MSTPEEYVTESSEHYYLGIVDQPTKEDLRRRHGNARRHYHTWDHVRELFRMLEMVDEAIDCLPGVILAVVYHDAVYNPQRTDNELRSAVLMRRMSKGLDLFWVERADAIIMATADHRLPEGYGPESDMAYFLDMDMAILGSPTEHYARYAQQVRLEYSHLRDEEWAKGRGTFLAKSLVRLERNQLYHTAWANGIFSGPAQQNIRAELMRLTGLAETEDDESAPLSLEG